MRPFLRRLGMLWRRGRGGQVVIFEGASDIERTRAFAKGAICGVLAASVLIVIAAPRTTSSVALVELERREELLRESNERAAQAIQVADVCLATANSLERTLSAYQVFLGREVSPDPSPLPAAD
jgi:hypothetical protein